MNTLIEILASTVPVSPVPDSGPSIILLSLGIIGIGALARFIKTRGK